MNAPTGQRMPPASLLFPWRAWMHHPWLRSPLTWTVVALVSVPPLALTLLDDGAAGVVPSAVVFAAYFAVAWAMVLRIVVRPRQVDGAALGIVVALGLVLEVPVALALERMLDADTENLLLGILTVGVPEELAKLLPVAGLALVYRKARTTMAPRDFLYVGAVSGLVFGAVEAVHYAVDVMDVSSTEEGMVLVWRLVAGPISHACLAGVSGYFLGLASRYREPGPLLALGAIGIGVPAVLHGLSNRVAGSPAWVLVEVVATLLFLGYARVGVVAAPAPAARTAPPAPLDPPTVRIPAVPGGARHTAPVAPRPTVGAWTPTPRSAPSPSWRP